MTVKELLERMDSRELTEWRAYYNIDPWGEERADLRQAQTSAIMASAFDKKQWQVKDFMLSSTKRTHKTGKRQTTEEMKALLMSIGKVKGS
jgi:hypothetical protein